MEAIFQYDTPATGSSFIGRKEEAALLCGMIRECRNVFISDIPKSGKTSLIYEALHRLKESGFSVTSIHFDMGMIRSRGQFLKRYCEAVYSAAGGTCPPGNCSDNEEATLSLSRTILPDSRIVVIIDEFQNMLMTDECEDLLAITELVWRDLPDTSFIFCGSMINSMERIFREERYFHGNITRLKLGPVDGNEIFEHVNRGFLRSGKVIEKDLAMKYIHMLDCNCWYLKQLLAAGDSLSRGYINANVMAEAMNMLMAVHEPRFLSVTSSMTGFQMRMLTAILEGVTKFCSSDIISQYRLNSSANVRRIRDALAKKEIAVFGEDDIPRIPDPLFRVWAEQKLFGK